jgi:hypothetical protein
MEKRIYKDRKNPDPMETITEIEDEMKWLKEMVGQKTLVEVILPYLKFDEGKFKRDALEFSEKIQQALLSEAGQKLKNNGELSEQEKSSLPFHAGSFATYYRLTVKNYRLDDFVEEFLQKIPFLRDRELAILLKVENIEELDSHFLGGAIKRKLQEMLPYESQSTNSSFSHSGSDDIGRH